MVWFALAFRVLSGGSAGSSCLLSGQFIFKNIFTIILFSVVYVILLAYLVGVNQNK